MEEHQNERKYEELIIKSGKKKNVNICLLKHFNCCCCCCLVKTRANAFTCARQEGCCSLACLQVKKWRRFIFEAIIILFITAACSPK